MTRLVLPVLKMVKLGLYTNAEKYIAALESAKLIWPHDTEVRAALRAITYVQEVTDLNLVEISAKDLGLRPGVKNPDSNVLHVATNRGLQLCPAEVGPALRLQYANQPRGVKFIAMKPILKNCFLLTNLMGGSDPPTLELHPALRRTFSPDYPWVFVQPKKAEDPGRTAP